jgi:prevent-host-death family protein
MSTILNVTEAKAKFSEVVERASQGEEIIVTRMGHPIARITRYDPAASNRRLGFFTGRIRVAADFDDWPEDIARDLGIAD